MPKTVLLVDDNNRLREVLAYVLRCAGFEVLEAATGSKAIEKAFSRKPDVIMLDLELPDMPGSHVARVLKNHSDTATIPIVGWTGYVGTEHRDSALSAGMVDCLVKPLPLAAISKKLEAFIHPSR